MLKNLFHSIKYRLLQDAPVGSSLAKLETSWDPRISWEKVRRKRWTWGDWPYVLMVVSLTICLSILQTVPAFVRVLVALALFTLVSIPITSQFFLPAMPILTWLVLFASPTSLPLSLRPKIYVRLLPALETILYGGNLSYSLAQMTHPVLDILAWLPYGVLHFALPFILAASLFVFGPPGTLPQFGFCFGWMNYFGVIMELMFPNAPPWYKNIYGLQPANYTIHGSAGGLERIDKILGFQLYGGTFGASGMVFGAFPSMHSGSACMLALFASHLCPRFTPLFFSYVLWIWWSTMYLTHHYFIDLTGGACFAYITFFLIRRSVLPRIQPDKISRWSYDYVERGIQTQSKFRKSMEYDREYIEMADEFGSHGGPEHRLEDESDDADDGILPASDADIESIESGVPSTPILETPSSRMGSPMISRIGSPAPNKQA